MTRRKQVIDGVGLVARLTSLVVLICLFFPAVRRAFAELGFMTACVSILAVAGLFGFGIYRLASREGQMKAMTGNPFAPPTAASDRTWNDGESEDFPDFLYPMLRRRYPWRH
jgi:high-affinity Fe2+/Pb2+ permease